MTTEPYRRGGFACTAAPLNSSFRFTRFEFPLQTPPTTTASTAATTTRLAADCCWSSGACAAAVAVAAAAVAVAVAAAVVIVFAFVRIPLLFRHITMPRHCGRSRRRHRRRLATSLI